MFFRDVEYVTAISRCQSITKAAEQLYITQPTLSIYLKKWNSGLEFSSLSASESGWY